MPSHISISEVLEKLSARAVANGGFSVGGAGRDRPDATAWAAILLTILDRKSKMLRDAAARLADFQLQDGRVTITPDQQDAFWPTPLAVLAWSGSHQHTTNRARAVRFLLQTSGTHWPKHSNKVVGHDTSLRGWPWLADTHSWVESTALNLIALESVGYQNHSRLEEATEMLMDRQLRSGGWNYGNTVILGRELRPSPEYTGAALAALAGRIQEGAVRRSLDYLLLDIRRRRTPIALGWGILGLSAWGYRPHHTADWVMETLAREERFGRYDTGSLCLLLVAYFASEGLKSSLRYRASAEAAVVEMSEVPR